MKKAVLKTILRDFFKLKYPLAMILVIVVLGAGLVWAGGAIDSTLTGYRSNHNMPGMSATASTTSGARAVIITNTAASSDYFVPTRTPKEWTAFLAHCPAGITVAPASSPAGTYYNGGIRCTDTNLSCPTGYFCINGKKIACPYGESSPPNSTSLANCIPAPVPCVVNSPCVAGECGIDNCGNVCSLICDPNIEFCNNQHQCQPINIHNPV